MNEKLRQCQLLQLDIAKEVKRICEKYNIQYFLNAGTLLGAVRHKGFIPWDDDLDIGMLRGEYEKFIKIAPKELGEKYFLQTWDTDLCYAMPFAKIRINNTKYVENNSRNVKMHQGVYIDIFPYDNIPDNKIKKNIQKYKAMFYWHLLLNKSGYNYVMKTQHIKYLLCIFLKMLSKLFSYKKLHGNLNKIMNMYNNKCTKNVVTFGGASNFDKEVLTYEWVEKTEDKQFEDTMFKVPYMWDRYLTHFYGDYMTPPPEDERYIGHNIIECDFQVVNKSSI